MKILGIETSCDETAVSIVEGTNIVSEKIFSQVSLHSEYAGVVPELASREHLRKLNLLIQEALTEAGINYEDIDAVAVTAYPGLEGSLLVGLTSARTLSYLLNIPIKEVDHIEAHLFSHVFTQLPPPPGIGLVISGGHSRLFYIKKWGDYEIIGDTRDDAVGESFDKVASLLGLPYPGGPSIEKASRGVRENRFNFPVSKLGNSYDFSYSGLKTAVLYKIKYDLKEISGEKELKELASSFQKAALTPLVKNSIKAAEDYSADWIFVCGGVAANSRLRELFDEKSPENIKAYFPGVRLCTDNASMVAACGGFYLKKEA